MPSHSKLPDLLESGLDLVICGTAAGAVSAKAGQYYAGPGNRFWSVLHGVGLTDRLLDPSEYRIRLSYGIGLTDVWWRRACHGSVTTSDSLDSGETSKQVRPRSSAPGAAPDRNVVRANGC
jgi:mismatch-specific thymine-DNA glycosylase